MPQFIPLPDDNMIQAYGMMLFDKKHPLIKKLNKHYKPSVHGHKTWLSSFLLIDYLLHQSLVKRRSNVLELGCGWGNVSIYCALQKAKTVTGLDVDKDVFPFLEVQASLNDVVIKPRKKSFDKLSKKDLASYNLLVGADICFWDELVVMHKRLIKRALASGVKDIILADPGRSTFNELVDHCLAEYDADILEWYSAEPEYNQGFILHIKQ